MQKPRRSERVFLVADVAVQPNDKRPQRFAARMFNVSEAGVAVFSKRHFSSGEIVGVELNLPADGRGTCKFMLYGTVRRVQVQPTGNVLGIEFVVGGDAGDYESFARYMNQRAGRVGVAQTSGFTLVEACIAMTVVCLLATMAMPLYRRAVEQARVDVASAKLKTIWSAQRVHWLESRTFATDLSVLQSMDLLDSSLVESQSSPDAVFVYQMVSADDETFLARAVRNGSGSWAGQVEIDESGRILGQVTGPDGQVVVPPPP